MLLKDNIPFQYVFGKIKYELVLVGMYTSCIELLYHQFNMIDISIPLSVPMIMGTVISLLLAFRSSQAYERWWEARTIWGAIVNDSRTLARQILSFLQDNDGETNLLKEKFIKRQIAWCRSLNQSLRHHETGKGLEKWMSKRELHLASGHDNLPVAILDLHSKDIAYALEQGWLNAFQQVEIDRTLSRLCDSMGGCERIKNTVFPATYSLYIHFAMNFFIILLPFALIEYFGVFVIPMVMAISASFMLIEKMAIHLQDPFENKPTDTPMTAICLTIERNLKQMLNDDQQPEATVMTHKYYVL